MGSWSFIVIEVTKKKAAINNKIETRKRENIGIIYFLTLKDQVIKNSATNSPASFLPIDLAVNTCPSPVLIAANTVRLKESPSSQRKLVLPVAFLKYFASKPVTNIEIEGST